MNDTDPAREPSPEPPHPAVAGAESPPRHGMRRVLTAGRTRWVVTAGLACAVLALAGAGSAAAAATPTSPASTATAAAAGPPAGGGGPSSGPATGGATGIVKTTTTNGFTMSTATGVTVTVDQTATTKIQGGSTRSVRAGASVLVLGTVDSDTVSATRIIVQPHGDGGVAAATKAGVIAFQQGQPSPPKSVGQIPSDYTEGDGTIVDGTAADKAIRAAQTVVPGGVDDRVVRLSDGEYEVHNIGVNWPHHVFVSATDKVLGYE